MKSLMDVSIFQSVTQEVNSWVQFCYFSVKSNYFQVSCEKNAQKWNSDKTDSPSPVRWKDSLRGRSQNNINWNFCQHNWAQALTLTSLISPWRHTCFGRVSWRDIKITSGQQWDVAILGRYVHNIAVAILGMSTLHSSHQTISSTAGLEFEFDNCDLGI